MRSSIRDWSAAGIVLFCVSSFTVASAESPLPPDPQDWVCPESAIPVPEEELAAWCAEHDGQGQPAPLPVPIGARLSNPQEKNRYDRQLNDFLQSRAYAEQLGWARDQEWRLTGPLVGDLNDLANIQNYGSHLLVRLFYSPEIVHWLCQGRQGPIADGGMIIKETRLFESVTITTDAQNCMFVTQPQPDALLPLFWSVMVRANEASYDGWYWPNPDVVFGFPPNGNPPLFTPFAVTTKDFFGPPPIKEDPTWYPTGTLFEPLADGSTKKSDIVFPNNSFGSGYCLNCHASAAKFSTFVSLENIVSSGLHYKFFPATDPSAPSAQVLLDASKALHSGQTASLSTTSSSGYVNPFSSPLSQPGQSFLDFYGNLGPVTFDKALPLRLPAETYDQHVSGPKGPGQFLTSDQCIACHDAAQFNNVVANMLVTDPTTQIPINVSPYSEWRVSPMGLAGRDPIFYSQLQSETNTLPIHTTCIENTCLHCHGVMGQRQYALDHPASAGEDTCKEIFAIPPPPEVPFGKPFARKLVGEWKETARTPEPQYGALAREGISCTVCHHIAQESLGQEQSYTGNFVTGPATELYGPYTDDTIVPKPMQNALGITPRHGQQVTDSKLCASCHNVLLPVFNNDGTPHTLRTVKGERIQASYEQATGLEWDNSVYAKPGESYKTCQDCHMPGELHTAHGQPSQSIPVTPIKIAVIQDDTSAPTTFSLPVADITQTERDSYSRHALHGLNLFLNEMFQQFPLLLGLRQIDALVTNPETPFTFKIQPGLITGRNSMLHMASQQTAEVQIESLEVAHNGDLHVKVLVKNKAGHTLPSGVGFRRMFLELVVKDINGKPIWASGLTNELGVILEGLTGKPLETEDAYTNRSKFQPHYQQITKGSQVQIYEELYTDSEGKLTTSFLRRVHGVKNNRLKPKGFDPEVFANNPSPYIQDLGELVENVADDPYYTNPQLTGADEIEYVISFPQDQSARLGQVTVALYSQSIPPFYLQHRFTDANAGPAEKAEIQRLYYMTSHLNTETPAGAAGIQNWKLKIAATCAQVQSQEVCQN